MKQFCILGNPVSHSKSPKIFNYLFKQLNLDAKYLYHDVKTIELFKNFVLTEKNNYDGFNITAPYKEDAYNLVDEVHSSACLLKTVNCVKIINNKLIGYNTDYYGFKMLMSKQSKSYNNKNFLILGNGATARTACLVLNNIYNCNIYIWGRNNKNVKNFISTINNELLSSNSILAYDKITNSKFIVVNCLPIIISKNDVENIFKTILLQNIDEIIDINYVNTILIDKLRHLNYKVVLGYDMLLFQALKNLDIWFEKDYSDKIQYENFKKSIFQI